MMLNAVILLCLTASAIAFLMYIINSLVYRHPPNVVDASTENTGGSRQAVSVLVPARNEEAHIADALHSILANRGVELEVLVLDDHSMDGTASILQEIAHRDARVKWSKAPDLPDGWCGKQHACQRLAEMARHPWLIFLDADVRLTPDAIPRMLEFMRKSGADFASGIPRQQTLGFLEKLLLPLIHFVLMGYLPMPLMRLTRIPACSAGCGQLVITRRKAYWKSGGHASIRASLHDGITLPRAFREAGCKTDLFDATTVASCRMYEGNRATWLGLQKNATEGLAAPGTLLPMTVLLFLGQILPFLLAPALPWLSDTNRFMVLAALIGAWLPRFLAARTFRQSWLGALLHPIGITSLLVNQWQAWIKARRGAPQIWRDRHYPPPSMPSKSLSITKPSRGIVSWILLGACISAWPISNRAMAVDPATSASPESHAQSDNAIDFNLQDQHGLSYNFQFPRTNALVLAFADRAATAQLNPWIRSLKESLTPQIDVHGIAPLGGVPEFIRPALVRKFKHEWDRPVLLDWGRVVFERFHCQSEQANIIVINRDGGILDRFHGEADAEKLCRLKRRLKELAAPNPDTPTSAARQSSFHSNSVE